MAADRGATSSFWEHFPEVAHKIKDLDAATQVADDARREGRIVVTLNGSFDLFHAGHLSIIRQAKTKGDVLIIGLNSDESYRKYKDRRGPLVPQAQRALTLAALSYVDHVVLFDEPDPIAFLEAIRPAIHCNGSEYGEDCVEARVVRSQGGRLCCVPELTDEGHKLSTSELVARVTERYRTGKVKAVILDRDGVINEDLGYVHKVEDFRFREGAIELLRELGDSGYRLIVVTNQSGVARGYFTLREVDELNRHMLEELRRVGVTIAEVYVCPHHPDGTVREYAVACDCRKPRSMLFQRARKEHDIDASASWAVGDKLADCEAAKRAGFRTILVRSTYSKPDDCSHPVVDRCVSDLAEIREIVRG